MIGFMRRVDEYKYAADGGRELVWTETKRNFPPTHWENYKIERELRSEYHISADMIGNDEYLFDVRSYDPDDDTYNSPENPWRRFIFTFNEKSEKTNDTNWVTTRCLGDVAVDGYGKVVFAVHGSDTNCRRVYPYRASKYGGWDNCSGYYKPAYLARLMREGKAKWA